MKKFLLILIIIGIGAGLGIGMHASKALQNNDQRVLSTQSNQTVNQQIKPIPGIPKKINIPAIGINTVVESVGVDTSGRMDVPKNSDDTAWFDLGYRPGQVGNSVIDGHYDKVDGSPAAFWNVGRLQKGDKILVIDENGKQLTFAVTRLVKYPYDNFPIKDVFGDANVPMLNLITCHGQWNKNTKNYSERMVVYSQLIN